MKKRNSRSVLHVGRQRALAQMFREIGVLLYVFPVLDAILDPGRVAPWLPWAGVVLGTIAGGIGIYLEPEEK